MKLLVLTRSEAQLIDVTNIMAIGGKSSSGQRLPGLSRAEDYAVVSPSAHGISVVPLRGKNRATLDLPFLSRFELEDLTIVPLPASCADAAPADVDGSAEIGGALDEITQAGSDQAIPPIVLRHVVKSGNFDRGLIIAKTLNGSFEVIAHQGTDPSAPWLTESLLAETLSSRKSVIVPNVIGSRFERNHSLIGTGFLSVAAWPLTWRNEAVGAIIVGSALPQFEKNIKSPLATHLAPFAAQFVSAYLKEQKLEEQLKHSRLSRDTGPFLTQSPKLQDLSLLAERIAPSDLSVLVEGETGVGKEVLAKWIHEQSPYKNGPFVAVNCGAIPENLIESILFGHKRGSFTGAVADQTGKFLLAQGGTIFLDEVADLPLHVQGKLLRVLQERVVEPIGTNKPIAVNVRVLSATHKTLDSQVKKGTFREDLYYRLAELTLEIPPLRERPEDIVLIGQQFLKENKVEKRISRETWQWLQSQRWTGNVRELLSALKRASFLSQSEEITIRDFLGPKSPKVETNWLGAKNLDQAVKNFQSQKVKAALSISDGNRKNAADLLGVNQRTLFRYLEEMRNEP